MSIRNPIFLAVCLILFLLLAAPVAAYSVAATDLYNQGNNFTSAGNFTEAVAAYTKAIALVPGYFEAWNGVADTLNRNGQFDDALAASNRSLALNPNYEDGWINRGLILYNIGYQYEDKNHDMAKANELYAEQLAAFDKAIAIDPGNAEAWFNRGYSLAGMKRYDEAIAAFDSVQSLDPSYPKLQKNRQIAVQLRDAATAATPVYVKYAIPIALVVIVAGGIISWLCRIPEKKTD